MTRYESKRMYRTKTVTVEVYIPNRDRNGDPIGGDVWNEWRTRIEGAACELTGGACTTYEVDEVWRGRRERVAIVRVAVPGRRDLSSLLSVLGQFGDETNQESTGYTIDGQWFFLSGVG